MLPEAVISSREKGGSAARFVVSAKASVESAVALRQEERDEMCESYERIILEEVDKEVRE